MKAPASLNCTFMELKSVRSKSAGVVGISLNCTFMELKLDFISLHTNNVSVLIVPLWNWNYERTEQ